MTVKVSIGAATLGQLLAFASVSLGLDVPESPKPTKDSLRALIATSFSGDEITVEPEIATANGKPLTVEDLQGRKTVRINIPVQEHIGGGNQPVPVGCNGVVAVIQRGVDVDVPVEYVRILRDANKAVPVMDKNSQITGWTSVSIYPFNIVGLLD